MMTVMISERWARPRDIHTYIHTYIHTCAKAPQQDYPNSLKESVNFLPVWFVRIRQVAMLMNRRDSHYVTWHKDALGSSG